MDNFCGRFSILDASDERVCGLNDQNMSNDSFKSIGQINRCTTELFSATEQRCGSKEKQPCLDSTATADPLISSSASPPSTPNCMKNSTAPPSNEYDVCGAIFENKSNKVSLIATDDYFVTYYDLD